jgi:hypothetical protein
MSASRPDCWSTELVTVLHDELGRADTATLAKLFGSLSVPAELPSAVDRCRASCRLSADVPA